MPQNTQCEWIYGPDDEAVKCGNKQPGDRCQSMYGSAAQHGYCSGHYRNWCENNNPELLKAEHEKARKTNEEKKAKAVKHNEAIMDEAVRDDNVYGISQDAIRALGLDEDFDLEKNYALYKQLNLDPTQDRYDEKFAFACWLDTPEHKKTPKTIEEAAKILGCHPQTLQVWRNSKEVLRILSDNTESRLLRADRLVSYKMTDGALKREAKLLDLFKKNIKEIKDRQDAKPKRPPITEDHIREANEIVDKQPFIMKGSAGQAEKNLLMENMAAGNLEEIKQ
jgi:hypothetical protein